MNEYNVKKVCGAPDWSKIEKLNIDTPYDQTPAEITANAQICYNDDGFLVHLETKEAVIRAVEKGPLGMPCEDSCLEFFFRPVAEDPRYVNIEFNSNGCLYLGIATGRADALRIVPDEPEAIFSPDIKFFDGGWEIYYTVPFEFIRRFYPDFKAEAGKSFYANCYKCADFSTPPHYLSWNPITTELDFHQPAMFGKMNFVE